MENNVEVKVILTTAKYGRIYLTGVIKDNILTVGDCSIYMKSELLKDLDVDDKDYFCITKVNKIDHIILYDGAVPIMSIWSDKRTYNWKPLRNGKEYNCNYTII